MKLSAALEGYLLDISSRGYAPSTYKTNRYYLRILVTFLGDKDLAAVTADDIRSYMVHMRQGYKPVRSNGDQRPLGDAAIENVQKAVKSFFNWAAIEFRLPARPDDWLKVIKAKRPEIETFTQDEMKRLMRAAVQAGSRKRKTGLRDTLIVLLLLDTGIRLGELERMRIKDIDTEVGEITVRPFRSSIKSKPRTIPIGTVTKRAAWRYLKSRESVRPDDPLLITSEGHAVTGSQIQNLIHDIGECAGVHANPHKFRHTFAIEYLRNGGDVFTLKRFLGHTTLAMSESYVLFLKADYQNAHRKASPADNMRL